MNQLDQDESTVVARFFNNLWREASFQFWLLAVFLVLVFFTGGSARADSQSLVALRPLSVIVSGLALCSLRPDHLKQQKFLFGISAAIMLLVLLQLTPLPQALWAQLPAREMARTVQNIVKIADGNAALSVVPEMTWNTFYALFVPLAVLLLGVQLKFEERLMLLPIILALALLSGIWGLFQTIGDPQGALYLYRVTNSGTAVGLFANRNHQAMLLALAFPLLAKFASVSVRSEEQARFRSGISIAAAAVLVPLLLVTGSRAGLIVGVLGILSALYLYRKPSFDVAKKRTSVKFNVRYALLPLGVIILGGLTLIMSRAEALRRLIAQDHAQDLRVKMLGPISDMAWSYFPFGTGAGTFVPVYQLEEPKALLHSSYVNQAHNDWVDLYLTSGLAGIILALVLVVFCLKEFAVAFRSSVPESRQASSIKLGAIGIMIFAVGSLVDYPGRTPIISALLVLLLIWMTRKPDQRLKMSGS